MKRGIAIVMFGAAMYLLGAAGRPARQFLNFPGEAKPPGYSRAVSAPAGRMVFISGTGGTGPDGKMPPDFSSQARNTFENMGRILKQAGVSYKDLVKINYFVTDLANTAELRRIRADYLNMNAPPAATLVQSGLGGGLLLEVEAVAIAPQN
jgi:enamine deaminase RidA (YjgF/YER057c/UK114 family)